MTSKIKVDNINKVSDDSNIIKKCGSTTTVGSGAGNTVVVCGSTVTIGRCGGTVALASGATQTGFGRTGSVNWQTTKKTTGFTAVSGEGYFCDTAASGAFTLTLPSSPSAGDIVGLKDYNGNFATANLTIGRGGSNLDGNAGDRILNTANLSLTLVYVDATQGWVPIEEGTGFVGQDPAYVAATGGTITTIGDFKVHAFTGPGTFTVTCGGNASGSNTISNLLVVAGGGGGSKADVGAGGGAGGLRNLSCVSVTAQAYPIVVGGGASGKGSEGQGNDGSNSSAISITSAGGGGGG
jgi:hypothetical protein